MVNENNLPPIENKKPFETVYELKENDYRIKTSKLSLAARSKIIKRHGANYLSERAFTHDLALMEMYGPGFWGDFFDAGLFVGKTVLIGSAATAITVATGGAAIPIGAGMWAGGKVVEKIGKDTDCRLLQSVGGAVGDLGLGTATAGIFTGVGAVQFATKYGLEVWQVEKIGKIYGYLGHAETTLMMEKHYKHKNQGISYDRDCRVCNI